MFVKICGIADDAALSAAIGHGADMLGFDFRRHHVAALAPLVNAVPSGIDRVGVFADADDAAIGAVLALAKLDLIQLDGTETPNRLAAIRATFRLPIIRTVTDGDATPWRAADWLRLVGAVPANFRSARPFLLAGKLADAVYHRAPAVEFTAPADEAAGAIRIFLEAARDAAHGVAA